ncbi:histidine kinase [Paenibacillus sp. sgz302251]|uniref:sensor histidine kinase n=1 Tax=Paenibacillus sp. sgz302251 TaxID=3414493 RepID=UPI003C7CABE1
MVTLRIRPLLLLLFLSINLFYLLAIVFVVYSSMSRIIADEESDARRQLLNEVNKQITLSMRSVEETGINIASHQVLLNALSYTKDNLLENLRARRNISDVINHFIFTSTNFSSIRIYTDKLNTGRNLSSDEPFAPLSDFRWSDVSSGDTNGFWMKAHQDPTIIDKNTEVLAYVRVLKDQRNEFAGFLKINVKSSYLFSYVLDQAGIRSHFLIDSAGGLVAPVSDPLMIQQEADFDSRIMDEIFGGLDDLEIRGDSFLVISSEPNYVGWRVMEIVAHEQLFSPLSSVKKVLIVICLIGILLSFIISYYLSKKMTNVVSGLLESFKQVETGSFDLKRTNYSILEIQQMHVGLQRMTKRLDMLLQRLESEHKQKTKAELNALLTQINPHFLYNTLDTIQWMVVQNKQEEVVSMIAKLSRLFRISLSRGHPFILLGEEIEHGALYCELQSERYKNDVRIGIDVSPVHKIFLVPRLILQPFIENAFIHGFNKAVHHPGHPLEIWIRTKLEGDNLFICIEDNGNPLGEAGNSNKDHKPPGGYGIRNVRERIQLFFGPDYSVEIGDLKPAGVRVTVKLPKIDDIKKVEEYTGHHQPD